MQRGPVFHHGVTPRPKAWTRRSRRTRRRSSQFREWHAIRAFPDFIFFLRLALNPGPTRLCSASLRDPNSISWPSCPSCSKLFTFLP